MTSPIQPVKNNPIVKNNITFYCPDRHIRYDGGRTPEKSGVGGGVNARIRLAQALARLGHTVTLICNCIRSETHLGVQYIPLDKVKQIETDVLILTTSGGDLSLEPILKLSVTASLKILLLHGIPKPKGIDNIPPDYYYPPSNFIRKILLTEWEGNIPQERIFVSHRGVTKKNFEREKKPDRFWSRMFPQEQTRDPFRLVYVGHPSKGREPALGVLNVLRSIDPRYHLLIFGDERLWGGKAQKNVSSKGSKNFGMVNQRRLTRELLQCSYAMFLQTRLEPYSNAMLEALSAGCIPIASLVGGFPEQVTDGWNGYLLDGSPNDPAIWNKAAHIIHDLNTHPDKLESISRNAQLSTYDWDVVARSWEQHWNLVLKQNATSTEYQVQTCPNCSKNAVHLADGFHCSHCGYFSTENETEKERPTGN